jgi:hypothetical protein
MTQIPVAGLSKLLADTGVNEIFLSQLGTFSEALLGAL